MAEFRSRLLVNERPLVVLPSLAERLGLVDAILLQQVQYWCSHYEIRQDPAHFRDGRWWVYNTAEQWQEQLRFCSVSTVKRSMASLRERGLLVAMHFGGVDRTLWWAVDHEAVDGLLDQPIPEQDAITPGWITPSVQNDPMRSATVPPSSLQRVTAEKNAEKGATSRKRKDAPADLPTDSMAVAAATHLYGKLIERGSTHALSQQAKGLRDKTIQDWAGTFDKLHRLDGVAWEDISLILTWLLELNDFWIPTGNFQSAHKLRQKDKSGIPRWQTFLDAAKSHASAPARKKQHPTSPDTSGISSLRTRYAGGSSPS
jgi:hypothetical protein